MQNTVEGITMGTARPRLVLGGREPRDFAEYCRATARAGLWGRPQRAVA